MHVPTHDALDLTMPPHDLAQAFNTDEAVSIHRGDARPERRMVQREYRRAPGMIRKLGIEPCEPFVIHISAGTSRLGRVQRDDSQGPRVDRVARVPSICSQI